jgi:hypothetical protein
MQNNHFFERVRASKLHCIDSSPADEAAGDRAEQAWNQQNWGLAMK